MEYSFAYQIGDHDLRRSKDRFRRAHYFPNYSVDFSYLYGDLIPLDIATSLAYLLQPDSRPDVLF